MMQRSPNLHVNLPQSAPPMITLTLFGSFSFLPQAILETAQTAIKNKVETVKRMLEIMEVEILKLKSWLLLRVGC